MTIESRLFGTWELMSYCRFHDGVFHRETMGPEAKGRIVYSSSGYMSAFLLAAPWARGEKMALRWDTFLSYSAQWKMLDEATIAHDVDMSSVVEFIGRRFVRYISWSDDGMLTLLTDGHTAADGHHSRDELVWRKVAAEVDSR